MFEVSVDSAIALDQLFTDMPGFFDDIVAHWPITPADRLAEPHLEDRFRRNE